MTMEDYSGVLKELVQGTWQEPGTGRQYDVGIKDIVMQASLDGAEAELVVRQHPDQVLTIISDPNTHAALGERVYKALKAAGLNVREYVWKTPSCSDEGVAHIRDITRHCDARIAVGSGTINDTVKYASFLDNKPYSVFATSPMTAYTSATASVSSGGFKQSITCRGARGVFFDLSVLVDCPPRLISAAFADVICRTTSQVDWLLGHILFDTLYMETPYTLLAYDEADMIAHAADLHSRDIDAMGMLARISAIMGLGTCFSTTTHSGSMAEHMISHYIDMFAGHRHPQSSHGEQVGVGTITMSQLQNRILSNPEPPRLSATTVPETWIRSNFSRDMAANMLAQTRAKAISATQADVLNARLSNEWDTIRHRLIQHMLPFDKLQSAMQAARCHLTASNLELDTDFYREAVQRARFIRDRFSMLDMADDSTGLSVFTDTMPV